MKQVRAKHPATGAEFTTTEAYAKRKGLKYDDNKPVRDQFGRHIPVVPAGEAVGGGGKASKAATRAELEGSAREAGIDDAAIAAASNKADLAALIEEAGK